MGWRIRVVHSTGYRYDTPVHQSYNEVRLTPRTDPRQNVIVSRVETTPADPPLPLHRLLGHRGHRLRPARPAHGAGGRRDVGGRDRRHAAARRAPRPGPDLATDEVARPVHRDAGVHRLRRPRQGAGQGRAGAAQGADARRSAVLAACRWVHEHLTYQPGTTGVHTSALEAWEAGKGVCQDYAHLTLLLLREAGIPARYVSGYLLPKADAEVRQTVTGESHAWIEAWTGGWWGYDPTNADRDRPAARVGRERPRLRRRAAAQGHLLRRHRLGPRRHGRHDPPGLSPARCFRIFITPAHSPCHDPAADRGVATSQSLRTPRRRRGPCGDDMAPARTGGPRPYRCRT